VSECVTPSPSPALPVSIRALPVRVVKQTAGCATDVNATTRLGYYDGWGLQHAQPLEVVKGCKVVARAGDWRAHEVPPPQMGAALRNWVPDRGVAEGGPLLYVFRVNDNGGKKRERERFPGRRPLELWPKWGER
jgi:hypothetical protein